MLNLPSTRTSRLIASTSGLRINSDLSPLARTRAQKRFRSLQRFNRLTWLAIALLAAYTYLPPLHLHFDHAPTKSLHPALIHHPRSFPS